MHRRPVVLLTRTPTSRWRLLRCGSSSLPARAGCPGHDGWCSLCSPARSRGWLRARCPACSPRSLPRARHPPRRPGSRTQGGARTGSGRRWPAAAPAPAPSRRRYHAEGAREPAQPGDPGVGADRRVPADPVDLLHGAGDPAFHGTAGQRGRARAAGRAARGRDPRQEVPGRLRRLQGQRLVPRPAGAHRHRQPAQRPAGGEGGHAGGLRRDHHQPGDEDQLPGDHRHARADDRAGRHDRGHDR